MSKVVQPTLFDFVSTEVSIEERVEQEEAQGPHGRILQGHVLDKSKEMPTESVQCVVTSPPYWGLRDYGLEPQIWDVRQADCEHEWGRDEPTTQKGHMRLGGDHPRDCQCSYCKLSEEQRPKSAGAFCTHCNAWKGSLGLEPTPELYVQHLVEIFREVKRVLRSDGTVWLNLGDSYWGSGLGGGESQVNPNSKQATNRGLTALGGQRRKEIASVKQNHAILKAKDLVGVPWHVAFALQTDGWWLRADIIWHKPNVMPSSVTDRTTMAHEYVFLLSKNADYFYDADAIREKADYAGKVVSLGESSFSKRQAMGMNVKPSGNALKDEYVVPSGRNKRSVWTINTQPYKGAHFATFPRRLIEPCILAGTSGKGCCSKCGAPYERIVESKSLKRDELPENDPNYRPSVYKVKYTGPNVAQGFVENKTLGWQPTCKCNAEVRPCVVFDPFLGSGTTAVVSETLGRDWIGIELNQKYVELAKQRLRSEAFRPLTPITEMKELKTPHFTEEEAEEQATFDDLTE